MSYDLFIVLTTDDTLTAGNTSINMHSHPLQCQHQTRMHKKRIKKELKEYSKVLLKKEIHYNIELGSTKKLIKEHI